MKPRTEDRLGELYRKYGYVPYKMSRFEEYGLYLRNKDFLQSDRVITFSGSDGRLLAMKPDVTLSIVKNAPEGPGKIRKVYYRENVYRLDRDSGNFREILQTGLECVGDLGFYEIAEVTYLAAKSLEALGGRTILSLSHVGLVRAVLTECGLSEAGQKQALDCLRQKREQELRRLCREEGGREEKLLALIRVRELSELEPLMDTPAQHDACQELKQIVGLLGCRGCADRVRLDLSLGNDMKYYSGLVFKGYVEGVPTGVLSGGQYDRLLSHMGKDARAIGFAVYLDQLQRWDAGVSRFDVDTLLLYGEGEDPAAILAAAQQLDGTVLAAGKPPADRTWRRLARLERGEVRILEEYA